MSNQASNNQDPRAQLEKLIEACGNVDLAAARALLDAGVSPTTRNIEGTWGAQSQTGPLHELICNFPDEDAQQLEALELLALLLERGADPNALRIETNWKGSGSSNSAFALALRDPVPEVLALLLQYGADANAAERRSVHSMRTDGATVTYPIFHVLRHALDDDDDSVLEVFLEKGVDVTVVETEQMHNERNYNADTRSTVLEMLAGGSIGAPTQSKEHDASDDSEAEESAEDSDAEAQAAEAQAASAAEKAAARAERREAARDRARAERAELDERAAALVPKLVKCGAALEARCQRIRHDPNPEYERNEDAFDDPRVDDYVPAIVCTVCEGTALHSAILARRPAVVRALLALKASRDARYVEFLDRHGRDSKPALDLSALELAQLLGNRAVLEALQE